MGSIRNKNYWNNASMRLFWELFSFRNPWISIPAILLRSRIAGRARIITSLFSPETKMASCSGESVEAVERGNPKTLTPGPRTPTTDRVRGLPTDRSTDYPYGPLYGPPPKKNLKKENRNKDFTYCLSTAIDHSCRNFERYAEKM